VTRLHGGKGSLNQQFISKLKGASAAAANDNDEEDEEMEMMLESSQHHNSSLRRNNSMNSDLDEDVEMTMDEGQEDDEASFQSSSSIDLSLRKSQTHQHVITNRVFNILNYKSNTIMLILSKIVKVNNIININIFN
jgi:hypothetical protein